MFKKIICLVIMLMAISTFSSGAKAQKIIWEKATTSSEQFSKFFTAMKKNNGVTKTGDLKVEKLCAVAFSVAAVKPTGYGSLKKYCELFKWQSGIIKGQTSITPGGFKVRRWLLPDNATVSAFERYESVQYVKSTLLKPRAKEKTQPVSRKENSIFENRLSNMEKSLREFGISSKKGLQNDVQMKKTISVLKQEIKTFRSNILSLIEKTVAKQLVPMQTSIGVVQDEQSVLSNKMTKMEATLTQKFNNLSDEVSASLPLGYQILRDIFDKDVADKYAEKINWVLFLFGTLMVAIVGLVYPYFFIKLSGDTKKLDKKITKLASQVRDLVNYEFDESIVSRQMLGPMEKNEFFNLILNSTTDGSNKTLRIVRSEGNMVTIEGAVRQVGVNTPLVCGVDKTISNIKQAITSGRVPGIPVAQVVRSQATG